MKHVPNYLTFLRLLLLPLFVALMVDPSPFGRGLAVAIFLIAAVTDYFDGIIARRYGATSDLGKLLDPLADKLLVMAALVMLLAQRSDLSGEPWVPGWMVVMVLAREIWVTGLRGLAAAQGTIVAANQVGKVKSFLQMVAVVLLLLHDFKFGFFGMIITAQIVGVYLLLVSLAISYWGASEYTFQVLRSVGGKDPATPLKEPSNKPDNSL